MSGFYASFRSGFTPVSGWFFYVWRDRKGVSCFWRPVGRWVKKLWQEISGRSGINKGGTCTRASTEYRAAAQLGMYMLPAASWFTFVSPGEYSREAPSSFEF